MKGIADNLLFFICVFFISFHPKKNNYNELNNNTPKQIKVICIVDFYGYKINSINIFDSYLIFQKKIFI